jgi:hypothetical protein
MLDLIIEFMVELLPEFMFKFFRSTLRFIGGMLRFLALLGKHNYQDILNKPYNGRIGFIFFLGVLFFIIYIKSKH